MNKLKKINFAILSIQTFIFIFWFKNGFIDKFIGILNGILFPETAYKGDTWQGWKDYIVGTWDKSKLAHIIFSPFYDFLFPIIVVFQCMPFILIFVSFIKGESLIGKKRQWLRNGAIFSLVVATIMSVTETLAGAPDGKYLWQFIGMSMVAILFIDHLEEK